MDTNEIARQAAADLVAEFGPTIVEKTEDAIQGKLPPAAETSRGWADVAGVAADIATVASFLLSAATIMWETWEQSREIDIVKRKGLDAAAQTPSLKPGVATKVIDAILRKIVPHH
jgi:hypothetical protein